MTHFMGKNVWYGDGENEDPIEDNPTEPTTTEKKPEEKPTVISSKTFTQEDLNRLLAEERRRAQKGNEKTIKQLEEFKRNQSLTEEEKIKLEERIETIKNEFLTKEEIAKKEAKKEREKQKSELETIQKEIGKWKTLYETSTVEVGLAHAASDPDIFNPKQIITILQPMTRLVEELDSDSGQPTGRFTPKVRLPGKNQDGKDVMYELTPAEAVKQMKEQVNEYGNLFRSHAAAGLGGNNAAANSRGSSGGIPPSDPQQFREWRKKNPGYTNRMT